MELAVIALLEMVSADRSRIEAIRRRFDPQHGRLPPHVTLVFPKKWDEAGALADVRRAAASETAFAARLSLFEAVGDPRSGSTYLYLFPSQGVEKFASLHEEMAGAEAEPNYKPHITVGKFEDQASALDRARELNGAWPPVDCTIRTLQVLRLSGGWIVPIAAVQLEA